MADRTSESITPHQVQSVYRCMGKFVSFMFKKGHHEWVSADIAQFGSIVRNTQAGHSYFSPCPALQQELGHKGHSTAHRDMQH